MPKVSIIIPVYNSAMYLKQCLNSLINQTLTDLEIICINDGSTDNSAEILNEYAQKDSRIIVITQENSGLGATRNNGLEQAKGEYIGFVDSDDWIDENYYEKLYNAAKENSADIAICGFKREKKEKSKIILSYQDIKLYTNTQEKFNICDMPKSNYVWNKIYKRERVLDSGITFETGVYYEDVIYSPRIIYFLGELVTVPDTYYHYRKNPNSVVCMGSKKKTEDKIYAEKQLSKFLIEHNIKVDKKYYATDKKEIKILGAKILKIITWEKERIYYLFGRIPILRIKK